MRNTYCYKWLMCLVFGLCLVSVANADENLDSDVSIEDVILVDELTTIPDITAAIDGDVPEGSSNIISSDVIELPTEDMLFAGEEENTIEEPEPTFEELLTPEVQEPVQMVELEKKLKGINRDVARLNAKQELFTLRQEKVELREEKLAARMEKLDGKREEIENELADPDLKPKRRQRLEERLEKITQREAKVDEKLAKLEARSQRLDEKLAKIEAKLKELGEPDGTEITQESIALSDQNLETDNVQ